MRQQRNDALRRQAELSVQLDTEAAEALRERELQARGAALEHLARTHGLNAKLIDQFRQLAREEAQIHHNRILDEIEAQRRQAHAIDVGGAHKLEIEQRYNALREQENKRFHAQQARDDEEAEKAKARQSPIGRAIEALETGQIPKLVDALGNPKGIEDWADVATVALGSVMAGVGQLGQAVGSLVSQWVLMGNVGPNAFRKAAAGILASVAQQAATLAVMSLAYAALATTGVGALLLGGTPAQFLQAAALFAGVAVVAGLAGRAIAGNSFKNEGAGASALSSGGPSSTSRGTTTTGEREPIEISRTQGFRVTSQQTQQQQPMIFQPQIHVTISGEAGEAFRFKVIDTIVQNFRNNGEMRKMVLSES